MSELEPITMSPVIGKKRSATTEGTEAIRKTRKVIFDGVVLRKLEMFSWFKDPPSSHSGLEDPEDSNSDDESYVHQEKKESEESEQESEPEPKDSVRGNKRPSIHGFTAVVPIPERVVCNIQGQVCTLASHIDSTSGSFPFAPTQPCPILTSLGLEYTQWGFLCREYSTIVHPRHLIRHIHRHEAHRPKGTNFPRTLLKILLDHILEAYAIPNENTEFPLPMLPTQSIPGLGLPFLACCCPISDCSTWRAVGNSANGRYKAMWSHVERDHGGKETLEQHRGNPRGKVKLEERYILKPYYKSISQKDPQSLTVVVFDKSYSPAVVSPQLEFPSNTPSLAAQTLEHPVTVSRLSDSNNSRAVLISAEWLQQLRWGQWIQQTGSSLDRLRTLVEIPTRTKALSLKGSHQRLEFGLLALHQLLDGYLQDANAYIDHKHGDLRNHIHFGYIFNPTSKYSARSKAKYNPLNRESYLAYRRPLTSTLAMLLRVLHFTILQDPSLASLGLFPDILFKTNGKESMEELFHLYEYLMVGKNDEPLERTNLLSLLHKLLARMIRRSIPQMDLIDFPTDIVLILMSSLHGGLFRDANAVTRYCAMMAHGFTAIVVHYARLQEESDTTFVPFNQALYQPSLDTSIYLSQSRESPSTANSLVEPDEVEPIEEDLEVDEDIISDLERDLEEGTPQEHQPESTPVEELAGGMDTSSLANRFQNFREQYAAEIEAAAVSQTTGIFQYIAEEHDSFLHHGKPTPYGHMKYVWFITAKHAREEFIGRFNGFVFMDDGQGVIVHNASGPPTHLAFSQMAYLAKQAIAETDQRIQASLLPECVEAYLNFQWQKLTDDLSDVSVFSQPANHHILQPLRNQLLIALLAKRSKHHPRGQLLPLTSATGHFLVADAKTWLQHHDYILSSITAAFTLTCGIPPRDFQYQSLQVSHDVAKGYCHSFFIIQNTPALGNPRAKQRGKTFKECLWGISPAQAPSILYFLGILKMVFSTILQCANIIHPLFDLYIFIRAIPTSSYSLGSNDDASQAIERNSLLNGSAINRMLQEHTKDLNVRLTCGLLRNQLTAIYRQFFPWLAQPLQNQRDISAMDLQGQHETATSNTYYGHTLVIPRALRMTQDKAKIYLETSRALQILYGLMAGDEEWSRGSSARYSPFIVGKLNEPAALIISRALVCQHYGLGGQGPELGGAWMLLPVQPIAAPSVPSSTTTLSFAEIQRLQELQGTTSTSKDKRSLRDIQEEERARQQEADFLKWWAKEEERVRLEMLEQEQGQERARTGANHPNKNKGGKTRPRKLKVETQSDTVAPSVATQQCEPRGHQKP
ncbi:hypothetical protein OG21DRAFT_1527871 [Imleria badia]|nr:hypothetical protein OG21DRAFT_1527871 [Imleria badia]